ncbi:hypothetical protein VTK73DRAFT_9337 [Phialemonium thermophilum]|uniref:AB hydrolase-1 domain-containing protein n=1 Tax=Phialemonium thermophilum TaxID=223376 RepID=A0ABR3XKA6_9PEZI
MAGWILGLRPKQADPRLIIAGPVALSIGLAALWRLCANTVGAGAEPLWITSPRKAVLQDLSDEEREALPYPPDALPGGRDVETPYGSIHVFEWGPEDGEKVLLLHGIGTPCIALYNIASRLVERGCRVMLFDLFGRGYSDAPTGIPYDARLYASQILLVLASSPLAWTGDEAFHLVGYSLGGGLSVAFARYFPRLLRSVTLVAGGGLVRRDHVGWRSRLLYWTGLLPESLRAWLVRRRISPAPARGEIETDDSGATDSASREGGGGGGSGGGSGSKQELTEGRAGGHGLRKGDSDASGGNSFDRAPLPLGRSGRKHTVASVMVWQLQNHAGFVPAFVSSIRHAPIYERREEWAALGRLLAARRAQSATEPSVAGLRGGKVLLVLGASDPVVVREELIQDATKVLGSEAFEVAVFDSGHEVAIVKGREVADAAVQFWQRQTGRA